MSESEKLYRIICIDGLQPFKKGEVPETIHIVPIGRFSHEMYGDFEITAKDIDLMLANFAEQENDLVLDYEHQSLSGSEAPAAGWIKQLKKKKDGIWATDISFTDRATTMIKAKEYRYISPVIEFSAFDKETGNGIGPKLHSVALTNTPWFDGMQPLMAAKDIKVYNQYDNTNKKHSPKQKEDNSMFGNELKKLLGLKEDVTDKEVEDVLNALKAKPDAKTAFKSVFSALGVADDATAEQIVEAIVALKAAPDGMVPMASFTALESKFNALVKENTATAATALVNAGIAAFKIKPSGKDKAIELATEKGEKWFSEYVEDLPVIMSLKLQSDGDTPPTSEITKFNDLVAKYKTDHKCEYVEAFRAVTKANPELAKDAQRQGLTQQ